LNGSRVPTPISPLIGKGNTANVAFEKLWLKPFYLAKMLPVKPAIVSSASDYVTTKEAQAKKN
jgi:hypothetical protein